MRAEALRAEEHSLEDVANAIRGTDTLLDTLDERLDEPGREVLHAASALLVRSARTLDDHANHVHANGGSRSLVELEPPSVLSDEDVELIAGLLKSTIGYGFLDRTRITPVGFEVGEHVYALGLTPGEEVVIEQKTFTKRQATFEDQTEQEQQLDIELSSTYSTEIQEGFDRQKSLSDTWA